MTRAELTRRALSALNDAGAVYWSEREMHGYLADGLEALSEEAPYVSRTFLVPRRRGASVYQLPGVGDDILLPYRVWVPDQQRRLVSISLGELDLAQLYWQTIVGIPWYWLPLSWDQFLIWPAPAEGEGLLEVSCYVWAQPLTDDDDEPELHADLHGALATYAEMLGQMKQWQPEPLVTVMQEMYA